MALTTFNIPVSNGRVDSTNSITVTTDNDTNLNKVVAQFPHGSLGDLHFCRPVPPNFLSGTGTLRIRWRANATSGAVKWNFIYATVNTGQSAWTGQSTISATTTTGGTANVINESAITGIVLPGTNYMISFTIQREGTSGSDTCTAIAELLNMEFEYTADPTVTKAYRWFPAQALVIPAASGATRVASNVSAASSKAHQCIQLRHALSGSTDYVDCRFYVPSNYSTGMKMTAFATCGGAGVAAGNLAIEEDSGVATPGGIGENSDPNLASGTPFTQAVSNNAYTTLFDAQRSLAATPISQFEIVFRTKRMGPDNGDTCSGNAQLHGLLVEYSINTLAPQTWVFLPASGALAVSNPSTLTQDEDTFTSKFVAKFSSGVDSLVDYVGFVPSIYSSGGTVRIRWRANVSGGTATFRVDYGIAASGAASDPSLTIGSNISAPVLASGNRLWTASFSLGAALVASDNINIRVWRLGSTGSETGAVASATVEVLDVVVESNPTS